MERDAAHGLEQLICVLAVPPHIYIGGRGRGAARGAPSRSNPTWAPPPSRPPPFHIHRRGKEREGGGEGKGEAESSPFLLPSLPFLLLLFGL